MAKHRVGRGNSAVAREREVESSAHAMAFDGSDDRGGVACDRVHERLSHGGELVGLGPGQRGDFVQVGADGEKVGIAGDDERCGVVAQFVEGGGQGEHAGAAEPVGAVGGGKPEEPGWGSGLGLEELRRHGNMMHYLDELEARFFAGAREKAGPSLRSG